MSSPLYDERPICQLTLYYMGCNLTHPAHLHLILALAPPWQSTHDTYVQPPPVVSPPNLISFLCRLNLSGLATSPAVVRTAARLPSMAHHPCSIRSTPWRTTPALSAPLPWRMTQRQNQAEGWNRAIWTSWSKHRWNHTPDNPFCDPNLISALASFTIHGFLCSPSV